jgi:hypothetical protein
VTADARGWRVALVADALINAPSRQPAMLPDVLAVLEASGYGLLQLPPPGGHRLLLAVIADQVAEYAHHGYAVVALGIQGEIVRGLHWRALAALLQRHGVAPPPRHAIRPKAAASAEARRLADFLTEYDLPPEEQRRWRQPRQEER